MNSPKGEQNPLRPGLVVLAGGLAKRYGGCKPLAPVGVHGEAVMDLTVSDARDAGFGDIVIVVGPQTAPALSYHVSRCWPPAVPVSFALQEVPLGTAHALLRAREHLPEGPFAVVNADDVYGVPALELLVEALSVATEHALVSFALRDTIVTPEPVTRGTCAVAPDGHLAAIVERRKVTMSGDGTFTSSDGLEPAQIPGDTPVSVNLWGFTEDVWPVLEAAVLSVQRGVAPDGGIADPKGVDPDVEVLLPEVIGDLVKGEAPGASGAQPVRVLEGPGRCLGVTHAEDLPVVRGEIAVLVGQGLRPEGIWESSR